MRASRSITATATLLVLGVLCGTPARGSAPLVPGSDRVAIVEALGSLAETVAVAVAADEQAAAAAFVGQDAASTLRVIAFGDGSPREIAVPGTVRDLLFAPTGDPLFVLVHRGERRGPGETQLAELRAGENRLRRLQRLPTDARALDYWLAAGSLIVATTDELRTIRLNGMRSGPLYRVPGPNAAVALLAGSDLALVAQGPTLSLIDLGDPPGSEEMPVRERVAAGVILVDVVAAPSGDRAWARGADGTLLEVRFAPLSLHASGRATALAAVGKRPRADPVVASPLPEPTPVPAAPPEPERVAATIEPPPPKPRPAREPAPQPVETTRTPVPPSKSEPDDSEDSSDAEPSELRVVAMVPGPAIVGSEQLVGRVAGPEAQAVHEVVLYGPDSLLLEARRVRPAVDGSWSVNGLAPAATASRWTAAARSCS